MWREARACPRRPGVPPLYPTGPDKSPLLDRPCCVMILCSVDDAPHILYSFVPRDGIWSVGIGVLAILFRSLHTPETEPTAVGPESRERGEMGRNVWPGRESREAAGTLGMSQAPPCESVKRVTRACAAVRLRLRMFERVPGSGKGGQGSHKICPLPALHTALPVSVQPETSPPASQAEAQAPQAPAPGPARC